MALLLDTHTFLWFINDDPRLSPTAAERIGDPGTRVLASVVSAWEMVIKVGTGKLTLDRPLADLWPESTAGTEFESLDVTSRHVLALESPPLHHRDPFDRLLIAQALSEGLSLGSVDSAFAPYPIRAGLVGVAAAGATPEPLGRSSHPASRGRSRCSSTASSDPPAPGPDPRPRRLPNDLSRPLPEGRKPAPARSRAQPIPSGRVPASTRPDGPAFASPTW